MEEAQAEQQLPVLVLFGAPLELRLSDQVVQALHVGFQTLKWQIMMAYLRMCSINIKPFKFSKYSLFSLINKRTKWAYYCAPVPLPKFDFKKR